MNTYKTKKEAAQSNKPTAPQNIQYPTHNPHSKSTTKDIIYIGLLSALCIVFTTIKVPLPTGAMVHLGTAALFSMASVFGGFYAGLAGAIGSGIFDLIMGHSQYTVFSIVIKGLAGVIVGILTVGWRHSLPARSISTLRILLAMLVGAVWTAAGYFVAWLVVLDSYIAAITRLPASFLTSGIGILVALLLIPILRRITSK